MTSISNQNQIPFSAALEPGYVSTVSLKSGNYKIFVYIEQADGSKTYLPPHFDAQTLEKVKNLTVGLLNAHDTRRLSLNEDPYDIQALDASGLIKKDNSVISHDFLIQPVSIELANQMTDDLTLLGKTAEASTIKATDLWCTMEEVIRGGMNGSIVSNSVPENPPVNTASTSSTVNQGEPLPPSSNPSTSSQESPSPANSNATPQPIPAPKLPTSIDLDLEGHDLSQPNWYEDLDAPLKLRIIHEVALGRSPKDGVYEKIWNHFVAKALELRQSNPASTANVFTLLEREQKRLSKRCRQKYKTTTRIPYPTRQKAENIYEAYMHKHADFELKEKINAFMLKEFEHKEELFQRLREQADAEEVQIADWDRDWAKYHYNDDSRRFVQAVARWLDNDG
jgi:hypothetical protein